VYVTDTVRVTPPPRSTGAHNRPSITVWSSPATAARSSATLCTVGASSSMLEEPNDQAETVLERALAISSSANLMSFWKAALPRLVPPCAASSV